MQFWLYVVPLAVAAVISAGLTVVVFQNRHKRTAPQILAVLIGATFWAAADALRLLSSDLSLQLFWHNVRFLGSTVVVLAAFLHALEYTNRERWLRPPWVAVAAFVFVVTNLLVWTTEPLGHDLIRAGAEQVAVGSQTILEFEHGPWFFINAAYSYLLLAAAVAMYAFEALQRSGTYRRQAAALIVAMAVPWLLNLVYVLGYVVVDLTGFGFTVTAVVFVAQLYWFQLLDVVPVARGTVVNHLESGYLVVDPEGRILDANEASTELFDVPRDAIIGQTIDEVFETFPEIVERFGDERDVRDTITVFRDGDRYDYDVDVSPVYDSRDRYVGRVVLVRDVTEQRRRQRKLEERTEALERQNEKLDRFASIVSHDLRNPIAVANGHLQIAREDGDEESFERIDESLERMDDIIDDVLALARQDDEITDPDEVSLSDLCTQAWTTVDTNGATLDVQTDATINADRGQLRRALENLFRNSVEHVGDDVTVTVGDLSDGFYVADDGPGIPEDEREKVLESGFTTSETGTGFGLSIVSGTADAHGWSLDIASDDDGGARFEFTDVAVVDDGDASPGAPASMWEE